MLAVVLALVLLVVGGVALVGALTSDAAPTGTLQATPTATKSVAVSRSRRSTNNPAQAGAAQHALVINVTGEPTRVYVALGGNREVLEDDILNTGDIRQFDQTPLYVVVENGGAVEVTIYGKRQTKLRPGQRGEWRVKRQ